MVSIKVNVKGLQSAFRKAEKEVHARVDKALQKNTEEIVSGAKVMAEAHRLTGALIESIGMRKVDGGYIAEITDEAAAANEWGTRKMAAQPVLFPVYRLNKKRSMARLKRAIKAGLKDAGLDGK